MKTLTLEEAAKFLNFDSPIALRRKAAAGEIPAAKPGKKWVFIEEDLVEYMRSIYHYQSKEPQCHNHRSNEVWHCLSGKKPGGSASTTTENEYEKALGLKTK